MAGFSKVAKGWKIVIKLVIQHERRSKVGDAGDTDRYCDKL